MAPGFFIVYDGCEFAIESFVKFDRQRVVGRDRLALDAVFLIEPLPLNRLSKTRGSSWQCVALPGFHAERFLVTTRQFGFHLICR